jgi:hypothetical protein
LDFSAEAGTMPASFIYEYLLHRCRLRGRANHGHDRPEMP